ncbi:hypothetical protein AKJ16_DCAP16567 [Drosera capensis]
MYIMKLNAVIVVTEAELIDCTPAMLDILYLKMQLVFCDGQAHYFPFCGCAGLAALGQRTKRLYMIFGGDFRGGVRVSSGCDPMVDESCPCGWVLCEWSTVKVVNEMKVDSESKARMVDVELKDGGWKSQILRQWSPQFKVEREVVDRLPIWIHLVDMDLEFWSKKVLDKIANKVGYPIRTDQLTADKEHISFALILVDVVVT